MLPHRRRPTDYSVLVNTLRVSGKFAEAALDILQEVAGSDKFKRAQRTCLTKIVPAGAKTEIKNSFGCLEDGSQYAVHPLFRPNSEDEVPENKGVSHPNVAFLPWFDRPAESVEAANKMVSTALGYSAKRIDLWNQKETDPAKIQAAAKNIASLSSGCLSHSQGLAAASGAMLGHLPIRTGRAASALPEPRSCGEAQGTASGPAAASASAPAGPPQAASASSTSVPAGKCHAIGCVQFGCTGFQLGGANTTTAEPAPAPAGPSPSIKEGLTPIPPKNGRGGIQASFIRQARQESQEGRRGRHPEAHAGGQGGSWLHAGQPSGPLRLRSLDRQARRRR